MGSSVFEWGFAAVGSIKEELAGTFTWGNPDVRILRSPLRLVRLQRRLFRLLLREVNREFWGLSGASQHSESELHLISPFSLSTFYRKNSEALCFTFRE